MRVATTLFTTALAAGALAATVGGAGCLRSTAFECETSSQCGAGGTCEPVGYCSFADPACPSGQRFGESAGPNANQCVDGSTPIDGGVDGSMPIDGMVDAPPSTGCPAGFDTITGGQTGHTYRLIASAANAGNQAAACAAFTQGAYLAVPDDATEMGALQALAMATTQFWVGIGDDAAEGTYVTAAGGAATFLPWAAGEPTNNGNGGGEDCVAADQASGEISTERCQQTQLWAICECVE